jgi:predicted ATPase
MLNHLLRSLVEELAPFVLVIEDLQWLDTGSWKMLATASQWTRGCMILATTRPVYVILSQNPNHGRPTTHSLLSLARS